jgi:hypothetical protein
MAALSPSDLVTRVLENIGRVAGDRQCPAEAITRRADDEYRRLRRRLSFEFPSLYERTSTNFTLTTTVTSFAKPDDCEHVRVVERQAGDRWNSIVVAPSLNRDEVGGICFYEQGANIVVVPPLSAPGVYRCHYLAVPPAIVTTYDVPDGMEGIIIEEVSAWARQRHEEDPSYHKAVAKQIWDDQFMPLWNRYGSHGQSALQITRLW